MSQRPEDQHAPGCGALGWGLGRSGKSLKQTEGGPGKQSSLFSTWWNPGPAVLDRRQAQSCRGECGVESTHGELQRRVNREAGIGIALAWKKEGRGRVPDFRQ